jgi:small-conductance mechanosensitive channel
MSAGREGGTTPEVDIGIMDEWIRLVGPNQAVEIFGVKLVGVTAENGGKVIVTILFLVLLRLMAAATHRLAHRWFADHRHYEFWSRQFIRVATTLFGIVGIASIWFDDPGRLAAGLGLLSAGLAFALQRVVTALAGYFVILRGETFNVGDRIKMGGVRGDVIGISFLQTTIMEMGQPPAAQGEDPGMWIQARQYSGRIVTVTNAKIFDEPVYNYTRDFPYIWEEIRIPVPYTADWSRAERILLEAAQHHAVPEAELSSLVLTELQRRYFMEAPDVAPKTFMRLTDNWIELAVRFVTAEHGIRQVKDRIAREVLTGLKASGIPIASATIELSGLPPVRVALERPQ